MYIPLDVFPLPVEIWGTVADWFMIAVTGVSVYFLWKSITAQTKEYKDEKEKHIASIAPTFQMKYEIQNTALEHTFHFNIVFTCKTNQAKDVIFRLDNDLNGRLNFHVFTPGVKHLMNREDILECPFLIQNDEDYGKLYFTDGFGYQKYYQCVKVSRYDSSNIIFNPIKINAYPKEVEV